VMAAAALLYFNWRAGRRATLDRFTRLLNLEEAPLEPSQAADEAQMPYLPEALLRKLRQAGFHPRKKQAVLLAAAAAGVGLLCLWQGLLPGMAAGIVLLLAAVMLVELRARSRMRRLSDAMMGFLERMRQLIVVGNSVAVALEKSVEAGPPILAETLQPAVRRLRNGGGLSESLGRCAADYDAYELHLLATAVQVNLRFGGSMTQIMRNMSDNLRKRNTIERQLRADTAQIRASAWVLAALPVIAGALVVLSNPDYARWFLETDAGNNMIAYALLSQLLGGFCMRAITRTRY